VKATVFFLGGGQGWLPWVHIIAPPNYCIPGKKQPSHMSSVNLNTWLGMSDICNSACEEAELK
jgi:hypothetical protein